MVQEVTADAFETEVVAAEGPVLVDFWAPACGPCRLLNPVLKELATELAGQFQFRKINVWDAPELASRFQIHSLPTMMIFKGGEVVRTLVGFQEKVRILRALQETA